MELSCGKFDCWESILGTCCWRCLKGLHYKLITVPFQHKNPNNKICSIFFVPSVTLRIYCSESVIDNFSSPNLGSWEQKTCLVMEDFFFHYSSHVTILFNDLDLGIPSLCQKCCPVRYTFDLFITDQYVLFKLCNFCEGKTQ